MSLSLPTFDVGALASLTKKIEAGFNQGRAKARERPQRPKRKAPEPAPKPAQDAPTKASTKADLSPKKIEAEFNQGRAKSREGSQRTERKAPRPAQDAPTKTSKKIDPPNSNGTANGRKRDFRGDVKQNARVKADKPAPKTHGSGKAVVQPERGAEMLEEILNLGGDQEDLALVADIASESEYEVQGTGQEPNDASIREDFRDDLEKFYKGLGIHKRAGQDLTDTESEPEGDVEAVEEETPKLVAKIAKPGISGQGVNFEPIVARPVRKASEAAGANRLKFEPRPAWHTVELPLLPPSEPPSSKPAPELLKLIHEYALYRLKEENDAYLTSNHSSSSSNKFLTTIMTSGTLSDKISALTLVVQESPLHTMKAFENLLSLAKKRSRGQAVTALGALKDLLGQGVVLPVDRKLRAFNAQPALQSALVHPKAAHWKKGEQLPGSIEDVHLIVWAYEDWLKTNYFDMIRILESWCNDEVEFARGRALQYTWELLREKPEQEANLMRLLVNKLGDPDKKIASKASYLLLQLQTTHPLMKSIIISSIESELLFRPGQSSHARYYAIITLNQTILSEKEEDVARKLLDVFFSLFVALMKRPAKDVKLDELPVAKINRQGLVQGGGGKPGKKAQRKAELELTSKKSEEELNEKLISAVLTGVNRAFPFAKSDDTTVEKHVDTLFRITHSSNFNTSIQALLLIQQISHTKQTVSDRFYRTLYESLLDPRLLSSSKQAMYLNLLFRALKVDANAKRVQAFVKRLLQVVLLHQPAFVCGTLYLIRELEGTFPNLRGLISQPEYPDDDDVEIFRDVPDDDDDDAADGINSGRKTMIESQSRATPSLNARRYDGRKRDPEHSNADKSCLWEILPFLAHFHPSVVLFADRLLTSDKMPAKPDLSLHTLIHFLDRFVYRNARSLAAPRGTSIMQPLTGEDTNRAMMMSDRNISKSKAPLNTEDFSKKKTKDVAVDEVFFHKYFNSVGKVGASVAKLKKQKKEKEGRRGKDEDDSDADDAQEDEIWKALVHSRPEVEGDDEGDSDLDELDSADMDSEGDDGLDEESVDVEMSGSDSGKDIDDGGISIGAKDDSDGDGGLDFGSEDDGMLDSDEGVPVDFQSAFNEEDEKMAEAEDEDEDEDESKLSENQLKKRKRRKLRNLPTFASAEDYAEMLGGDEDDED